MASDDRKGFTNEDYIEKFIQYLNEKREPVPLRHLRNILVHSIEHRDDDIEYREVESLRRSIMRKVRGDPRFVFTGTTRDRYVALNENTGEREANLKDADVLVREFIKHTSKSGANEFREIQLFRDASGHSQPINWDAASHVLAASGVVTQQGETIEWTHNAFFGFEPIRKRSSALSLPHRTWDAVQEIQQLFFDADMYRPIQKTDDPANAILELALSRRMPFNKSEIVEIALEHLRSQLQHIIYNEH
jgi:hypothetical protein